MSRLQCAVFTSCLAVHALLVGWGASRQAPNWDEMGHLPAGVSHWKFGRFDLYRVNPPLIRLVAAIPVVLADPEMDWHSYNASRGEFVVGRRFFQLHSDRALWYFTIARWACIPFSLLGAYVCFRWAADLYGRRAGLFATWLWCFSPNVIGSAQMITPAIGATATGIAAAYVYWRWLQDATWHRVVLAGGVLGLAELTKTTWIILFAVWPILWCLWLATGKAKATKSQLCREGGQLLVILVIATAVLNLGYGFEGSGRKLGDFRFVSQTLGGQRDAGQTYWSDYGNRFSDSWLGSLPVPLPANYVRGVDEVKRVFEDKMWSYMGGRWRYGGWWYYYLYAMLLKIPLGTWFLIVAAVVLGWPHWRNEMVYVVPALSFLAIVSSQTGFNHHLRYILPVFPAIFIWSSRTTCAAGHHSRLLPLAIVVAIAWSTTSCLWTWPYNLSYFNELAGGPLRGHAHLGGSPADTNIDCGQDLFRLKYLLDENRELVYRAAVMGPLAHEILGETAAPPPGPSSLIAWDRFTDRLGPEPGWYAISVNNLHRRTREYDYFLRFDPVDRVGYSIYIYHITLDEANRVRRDLGLPNLISAEHRIPSDTFAE